MHNSKDVSKKDKLEFLIRRAYSQSIFTQLWLKNNQKYDNFDYLEKDLQKFISSENEIINELLL